MATLDRAIGELRAVLSRRTTDGGAWHDELDEAVKSMNATEHSALFMREPDDVEGDDDLRFDLRYKNAEMRQVNVQLSKTRGENLERQGAFRTFLPTTTGFKRRAGQQNWSEKIHQVQSAGANGRVVDTEGDTFLMSTVKAVPSSTAFVPVPDFAMGGSRKVEDRRREALRQWLPALLDSIRRAGDKGLSVQQASRELAAVPGFPQALKDQRATLMQFAQLWPDDIRIEKRGSQNVLFARAEVAQEEPAAEKARPQRPRWPTRVFARPREPEAAAAPRPREPFLRLRPAEP